MDALNCLAKGREKDELYLGKYRCNRAFSDKVFRGIVILWDLPNPRRHLPRLILIPTTQAITTWKLNVVSIHAQHPGALSNARD